MYDIDLHYLHTFVKRVCEIDIGNYDYIPTRFCSPLPRFPYVHVGQQLHKFRGEPIPASILSVLSEFVNLLLFS